MKKRLTQHEEFEIMKLVLDKFLWLGFGIMAFGFYMLARYGLDELWRGAAFMLTGMIVLGLFVVLLVKEYEVIA